MLRFQNYRRLPSRNLQCNVTGTHKFIAQSDGSTCSFTLLANVLAESDPTAFNSAGEPKSQSPEKSTEAEIRTVSDHKVAGQEKKQPIEGLTITVRQQDSSKEPAKASTSSASITPKQEDVPEPDTLSCPDDDLRSVIEEKRESNAKMNELEEMERIIKEKEEDIRRRLERLEKDEASVTVAMLLPSAGRSRSPKDDRTRDSSITSRRSGGSTRRSRSPLTKTDGSSGHQRSAQLQNISSITPIYAGASTVAGATNLQRGTSPSDLLAHERFVQIRSEKIAISQELDSLRQRFSSRKSSRVDALEGRLAVLEREQRDLQIQLEIKQRFRMPDDVSYFIGTSFDRTPSPHSQQFSTYTRSRSSSRSPHRAIERRRTRSRSRSPSRSPHRGIARRRTRSRSRSPSRSPHRAIERRRTRSHSRSTSSSPHRAIARRRTRSRSQSRGRLQSSRRQQSRSPSSHRHEAPKRRRTRTNSRSPSPRRPDSMVREMYSIGKYNNAHGKHSIYVANISREVTKGELESIFDRYGEIDTIDFQRFTRYREVYIDYIAREDAFRALEMNNTKIGGHRLRIAFNGEKPSNREGYTLYLIPKHPVTEMTIYQTYESYGDIDFIWYPEGSMFCTVSFRRSEAATDALQVREFIDGTKVNAKPFRDRKW
ncbi:serine/arginine repetitive matrix protein 2-like [Anopheles bellator]|uniref:serine/arginine repetitive matrix protein 2-like n=1 Tax=Anopheles bellator TaxID=139047 RepID=UPI00264750E4|nr:serine/arginine repetitive matrix protein 2-like [Anopheles bellator]